MRLLEIYAWVITFTLIIAGVVLALIAAGGSRRKYDRKKDVLVRLKFTPKELRALEDFREDQRLRPPRP